VRQRTVDHGSSPARRGGAKYLRAGPERQYLGEQGGRDLVGRLRGEAGLEVAQLGGGPLGQQRSHGAEGPGGVWAAAAVPPPRAGHAQRAEQAAHHDLSAVLVPSRRPAVRAPDLRSDRGADLGVDDDVLDRGQQVLGLGKLQADCVRGEGVSVEAEHVADRRGGGVVFAATMRAAEIVGELLDADPDAELATALGGNRDELAALPPAECWPRRCPTAGGWICGLSRSRPPSPGGCIRGVSVGAVPALRRVAAGRGRSWRPRSRTTWRNSERKHTGAVFRDPTARPGPAPRRPIEVLTGLDLLDDDRMPAFERWLDRKLADLAVGIRTEVEAWLRHLRDGGPRARPRARTPSGPT